MTKHQTETTRAEVGGGRYLDLIRRFPLRPIRSDEDLDRAMAMVDSLVARDDLDDEEADYLDVLGDLMVKYEAEHHPMPPLSDAEILRNLIAAKEVTQAAAASGTGIAESTISEILAGKRALNRKHIAALSRFFGVNPAVFIPR